MLNKNFVLFDDALKNCAFLLSEFVYQDTISPDELDKLDGCLKIGCQQNLHVAIFADYEFGLALQKLPQNFSGSLKLLWFAQKDFVNANNWLEENSDKNSCGLSQLLPDVSPEKYAEKIAEIQAAISRGDCYQINYTMRLTGKSYGSPINLYRQLRQAVPYAALGHLPNDNWILCFSPELFLKIKANGELVTEPMKGTAPRESDPQALQNDPKNRAENVMIVDLLRNDLGKLAEIGKVSVPEPFKVSAFGAVWQMTSKIVAKLPEHTTAAQIFQAAFPCGSITGAPKRKSMELIGQLENSPRGIYTGSIGYLLPENKGLGFSGCLNVVIRTLVLSPENNGTYQANFGVGSGIVIDSVADDEYAECAWKSRFLRPATPKFGLFETMRCERGHIAWLPEHLARMAQSAAEWNRNFDVQAAKNFILSQLNKIDKNQIYRVKLLLSQSSQLSIEVKPIQAISGRPFVLTYPEKLPCHDFLRRHKTTQRAQFDCAMNWAIEQGAFDALLFNEDGFLLEGARSSVVMIYQNQYLTPDDNLDILPSIARRHFSGSLKFARIDAAMLAAAEKIFVGNALRGWLAVDWKN